jgi:hypothetical protein
MAALIPEMSSDGSVYAEMIPQLSGSSVITQLASKYYDTHGCRFLTFYLEWSYASGGPGVASTLTFTASNRNSNPTMQWAPAAVFGDCSVAGNVVTLANQLVGSAFVLLEKSPRFIQVYDAYSFTGSGDVYGAIYGTK